MASDIGCDFNRGTIRDGWILLSGFTNIFSMTGGTKTNMRYDKNKQ